MTTFNFADRYATAGIAPGPEIIALREAPAKRILDDLNSDRLSALVQLYYGNDGVELTWFRDEFLKEDASFSLINNARESKLLAAAILAGALIESDDVAILSLRTASLGGKRPATEAQWLQTEAAQALLSDAAATRKPRKLATSVKLAVTPKLTEEIASVAVETLSQTLTKVRAESTDNTKSLSTTTGAALAELVRQVGLMREETQMLWWLVGGYSRSLDRPFSGLSPGDAAVICGIELAELTTASRLGPIAAVGVLERVIQLAAKGNASSISIFELVDGFTRADFQKVKLPTVSASWIFPLTDALAKARDTGAGNWKDAFERSTGISSELKLTTIEAASQLYYEHLLGQLL